MRPLIEEGYGEQMLPQRFFYINATNTHVKRQVTLLENSTKISCQIATVNSQGKCPWEVATGVATKSGLGRGGTGSNRDLFCIVSTKAV